MRVAAVIAGAMALVLSVTPALAANPSPSVQTAPSDKRIELAHRYVTAMHMDQTMRGMFKTLMPQMLSQMPSGGQLTDQQRKVLGDVTTEVISEMMAKMMTRMEPIMAEVYSEQELTDIVAFYESPTGQSALAKAPLLAQKMAPMMIDLMPEMQAEMKAKICARIDCSATAGAAAKPKSS